jgi:hypothetical protein
MPITEIDSAEDAKARLTKYFLSGLKEETFPARRFLAEHIDDYSEFAYFLSNKQTFESALELASYHIWLRYNRPEVMVAPNRYTNAIANFGKAFGLSGQNSFVLVNEAAALFGELLKNGHLWKDSFAPGHGEFAHSYQWLSWAARHYKMIFNLYTGTYLLSWLPMFVKAERVLELRRVYLWEWLVDCTRYQQKFDDGIHAAAVNYLKKIAPKHGSQTAEPWTRKLQWSQVEEVVGQVENDYAKANVLCLDRYRNANNITDFVKTQNGWFIHAYETRKQRKIATRETGQKVASVHRLIGGAPTYTAPTAQEQVEWANFRPPQIASKIARLTTGQRNPGRDLQMIDIGKDVLLHHYTTKPTGVLQQEHGKAVRFDRTPPVGGLLKNQVRMVFHGVPGLMNRET